mmetsp:Transcript_30794/g.69206  ORF Transcript_30794/g.69206 Transcript_30794/m.69206 type:complete len:336 (+) Transcript_30794:1324-2331(+)
MLKAPHLALQPRGRGAQLRLEHGEVLLLHELGPRIWRSLLLHLEGVSLREVAQQDDRGSPQQRCWRPGRRSLSAVIPCQQDVGPQGNMPYVLDNVDSHQTRRDRRGEEHPRRALQERVVAIEDARAVDVAPRATFDICAGDPELRDPLSGVEAGRQGYAGDPLHTAQVHLVPRRRILLLRAPSLRGVQAALVVPFARRFAVIDTGGRARRLRHCSEARAAGGLQLLLLRNETASNGSGQGHRLVQGPNTDTKAEESLLLRRHLCDGEDLHAEKLPPLAGLAFDLVLLPTVPHQHLHRVIRQWPNVLHVYRARQCRREGRCHSLCTCIRIQDLAVA